MATAATSLISLDVYLRTVYRPDREFVDGFVEERNLGEFEHGRLQTLISGWLLSQEKLWDIVTVVEQRVRVGTGKVRIPDVCALRRDAPRERVITTAPLLCIEILSPEDRMPRVESRLHDFLEMGVQHLWVIDPQGRSAHTYSQAGLKRASGNRLEAAGTPIYLDLPSLFASLD